jgi:hypothetical protein
MAMRAAGLHLKGDFQESLEAIAADCGVSRETVRRARNELLTAIHRSPVEPSVDPAIALSSLRHEDLDSPATARALRRLLTMTGPLAWDEVLSAWARASGKHPYAALPANDASVREWAHNVGGLVVVKGGHGDDPVTVSVEHPEPLDKVSNFLQQVLMQHPDGLDRAALLDEAERVGLKSTTIATALSYHPAVMRRRRGNWFLRGHQHDRAVEIEPVPAPRQMGRVRPTTFFWADDGSLVIEFSVPRGPSPVVAVPKAIADLVEGREFFAEGHSGPRRIAVGKARLWGFAPLLSEQGFPAGSRVRISINLLAGTARLTSADRKVSPRD